jgi:hypothetical protein
MPTFLSVSADAELKAERSGRLPAHCPLGSTLEVGEPVALHLSEPCKPRGFACLVAPLPALNRSSQCLLGGALRFPQTPSFTNNGIHSLTVIELANDHGFKDAKITQ